MSIKNKIFSYFKSRTDLRVLFVFDGLGMLLSEIEDDSTPWPEDYVFYHFQGDWFSTKVRLASEWKEKKVVMLFNQIEPLSQDACLRFPLMSVLQANMVFHEQDAIAFMQQRGVPMQYADFFHRHINELHREKYDKVISPYYSSFNFDVGYRGMLSVYLGSSKMLEWYQIIAQIIIISAQEDGAKASAFWNKFSTTLRARTGDVLEALAQKLIDMVGFSFDLNSNGPMTKVVESMKYNAITQHLAVVSADPYHQLKIQNSIRLQQLNMLLECIEENTKLNEAFTIAFRKLGANIQDERIIDLYGVDANYACVYEKMAYTIIDKIVEERLQSNPNYVLERLVRLSNNSYGDAMNVLIAYLKYVCQFYAAKNAMGTLTLNKPDLYVAKYLDHLYLLDMYYRTALTEYAAMNTNTHSAMVEKIKAQLDSDYAAITNELNQEWVHCINEIGGGLSSVTAIERQTNFFHNHIGTSPKVKTVVIVSDAFRYELAKELMGRLIEKKHIATLSASLAMLPTETKYCKPSLLPHKSLQCTGNDMLVDGKTLSSTDQRTAHLQQYVESSVCINYDTLMAMDNNEKRMVFKHKLVYIFHNTLDENCHSSSLKTFTQACKDAVDELVQLISLLHDRMNVSEVYLTADHGFLYNDTKIEESEKHVVSEECIEKKTRYFISSSAAKSFGISNFKMQMVSPMEGDYYVNVPTGTNRIAKEAGDYQFAHGGASLQEMIVPLLHSKYSRPNIKQKVSVTLLESVLSISSSRLKVHLVQGEAVSMDRQELTVICAVYVGDEPVTQVKTITLNSTDTEMGASRIFEVDLTVTKSATSKIMQFRVYKQEDQLNPVIVKNIVNHTLIEQDDF